MNKKSLLARIFVICIAALMVLGIVLSSAAAVLG